MWSYYLSRQDPKVTCCGCSLSQRHRTLGLSSWEWKIRFLLGTVTCGHSRILSFELGRAQGQVLGSTMRCHLKGLVFVLKDYVPQVVVPERVQAFCLAGGRGCSVGLLPGLLEAARLSEELSLEIFFLYFFERILILILSYQSFLKYILVSTSWESASPVFVL